RMDSCHFAFWEFASTVDHIVPVSRGGTGEPSNLATTSMLRNSAKANFTLPELGWPLWPHGKMGDWDGLLGWFVSYVNSNSGVLADPYLRRWFSAAKIVTAEATSSHQV
ncbi:MAG TPA: HNH endonuclease, partial [Acetobacteraceae bacterium]|nr:HNH endonuclease [Acetobacteraceae bacterium]